MKIKPSLFVTLLTLTCIAVLASCGGANETNNSVAIGSLNGEVFVMQNTLDNAGTVRRLTARLNDIDRFTVAANRGMAFDSLGNLYIAGDYNGAPSSLQVIANAVRRARGNSLYRIPNRHVDRHFTAAVWASFRGLSLAEAAGYIFVANSLGNTIEVFSTAAGSASGAVASFATPASPRDLSYDELADRAFIALTDGRIMVVDAFVAGHFSSSASRLIRLRSTAATNLRGIAYLPAKDTLVVSDIAHPDRADDGKLYVIENASRANGEVQAAKVIAGPSTLLGNPLDLQLLGETVYVAENSNNKVLAFSNIVEGEGGNIVASFSADVVGPESLAIVPRILPRVTDISDIENPAAVAALALSLNPAVAAGNSDIVQFNTDFTYRRSARSQLPAQLITRKTIESIKYNSLGDAYVTFAENGFGGIYIINRAATHRALHQADTVLDRIIQGPATGLISPKGLDFSELHGLLIVAENATADPSIKVFSAQSEGNVAPLINTPLPISPWDVDYESSTDTLFIAATDGNVLVFDNYLKRGNEAVFADRVIRPTIDGQIIPAPSNLHGIVYVAGIDMLLLSDVGSPENPSDGKLYGIKNAARALGGTELAFYIDNGDNTAAGNTLLGNPVDIAFDGQHLYVAEKSQSYLLRFDNILQAGSGDISPSQGIPQIGPESVALLPRILVGE
ncbi:MAG: hypothetical protein KTR17_12655 [Cellvibrionaceae bacterium]|nr:hypothetical protein [Cellvibrionaceae bacterium]